MAVPRDAADLSKLVQWAGGEGHPLVPRGAATGMPGGNVGSGIAVELGPGFREIGPIDDRSHVGVSAGAVAGDLVERARSRGLFLPALPSSASRCTLGGMAANNAAGARSFKYGSIRAWIRRLEGILADGRRVTLVREGGDDPSPFPGVLREVREGWPAVEPNWPRIRKNSSGYALDHFSASGHGLDLVVGSEGTLTFITGLTVELLPEPETKALLLHRLPGPKALVASVEAAQKVGASACEFFGRRFLELADLSAHPEAARLAPGAFALLLVELDGTPEHVERDCGRFLELLGDQNRTRFPHVAREPRERAALWAIRHAASPTIEKAADRGVRSLQFIEDSVVPTDRLAQYLTGLDRILSKAEIDAVVFGHAGDGNVHVNPLVDVDRPGWKDRVRVVLDETVDLVARLGGTLSGEHGDGRVRAPYLDRIWGNETAGLFHSVKRRFDPDGILNPGVIVPERGAEPLASLDPGPRAP